MLLVVIALVLIATLDALTVELSVNNQTRLSAVHPQPLIRSPQPLNASSTLTVSIDQSDSSTQTLLILAHERGSPAFSYVFSKSIDVTPSSAYIDGKYTLEIALLKKRDPLLYRFGEITYSDDGINLLNNQDMATSVLAIKPEIHHKFRPDQKSPSILFPFVGVLSVLAPWLVLVPAWTVIKEPMYTRVTTKSLAFVLCLIAFASLYFLYWTKLNLLELLPIWLGLSTLTILVGNFTLREQAVCRLMSITGITSNSKNKKIKSY